LKNLILYLNSHIEQLENVKFFDLASNDKISKKIKKNPPFYKKQ
jgi:hypothetical protein